MEDHQDQQSSSSSMAAEPQHAGSAAVPPAVAAAPAAEAPEAADEDDHDHDDDRHRRHGSRLQQLVYRPRHVITSEAQHTNSLPALPPMTDDIITPQSADEYFARTLNSLSTEERTKAMEDVHGVSTVQTESPSFVRDCLKKFDDEISKLPEVTTTTTATTTTVAEGDDGDDTTTAAAADGVFNKYAYHLAMEQDPHHVRSLRILFLRSESFHIQHAAIRMVSYFDAKLDLFGPKLLTKDITIHDIEQQQQQQQQHCRVGSSSNNHNHNNGGASDSTTTTTTTTIRKDDMDCLNTGYIQLLPSRDRSGRPIACWIPGLIKDPHTYAIESKVRHPNKQTNKKERKQDKYIDTNQPQQWGRNLCCFVVVVV